MRDDTVAVPDVLRADPLADLLFTLIAAVLPAIFVLAPLLQHSTQVVDAHAKAVAAQAPATVTVQGAETDPIVAGADGIRLTGPASRTIALDRISDDAGLRQTLAGLKGTGRPLLLIIEPNGFEAAFAFEPIAAAYGPAHMAEVRATRSCRDTRDAALKAACREPAPISSR